MEEDALQDIRLLELAEFRIGDRAAFITKRWRSEPAAAIDEARGQGLPIDHVSPRDLIWAIAYNVTQSNDPYSETIAQRSAAKGRFRPSSYVTKFRSSSFTVDSLRHALLQPIPKRSPESKGLVELVISVACEQREDWRSPDAAPVNLEACDRTFEALKRRDFPRVECEVSDIAWKILCTPTELAEKCFKRARKTCWEPSATSRFLGLSPVWKFISKIAKNLQRECRRKQPQPLPTVPLPPTLVSRDPGPVATLAEMEAKAALLDCLARLSAREQGIVRDLQRGVLQKDIAAQLGVKPPMVVKLITYIRDQLENCMKARDHRREDW